MAPFPAGPPFQGSSRGPGLRSVWWPARQAVAGASSRVSARAGAEAPEPLWRHCEPEPKRRQPPFREVATALWIRWKGRTQSGEPTTNLILGIESPLRGNHTVAASLSQLPKELSLRVIRRLSVEQLGAPPLGGDEAGIEHALEPCERPRSLPSPLAPVHSRSPSGFRPRRAAEARDAPGS